MVTGLKGFVPRVEVVRLTPLRPASSYELGAHESVCSQVTSEHLPQLAKSGNPCWKNKNEVPNMLVVSHYQIDTPQGTKVCILGEGPGNSVRRC